MSSFASLPLPTMLPCNSLTRNNSSLSARDGTLFCGQRLFPNMKIAKAAKGASPLPTSFKSKISCSIAQPETLEVVQEIIAKQLSLEQSAVIPQTKFSDLGADSLDTVEIMMALEEKFGVSIGEGGAEGISTVQDAADLIEKVKASSPSVCRIFNAKGWIEQLWLADDLFHGNLFRSPSGVPGVRGVRGEVIPPRESIILPLRSSEKFLKSELLLLRMVMLRVTGMSPEILTGGDSEGEAGSYLRSFPRPESGVGPASVSSHSL